jgi:predicted DNA-binding transcriptional regulator AlpA
MEVEPLLISDRQAARLAGISRATWQRHRVAGKIPEPIKLGGKVLWNKREVTCWIDAGCPDAKSWNTMRPRFKPS